MNLRKRLLAVLAVTLVGGTLVTVGTPPAVAAPPAPVILNNGAQNSGNAQWMETQAQPDDGGTSVKNFWATFLVQHAVGRTINQVVISAPGNSSTVNVTGQTYVAAAGGIETSRVTVAIPIGKPGGFSCPFIGSATRRVDSTVTMRVIDSTGENSANVSGTVHFVEDSNCGAHQDWPRMTSVSQNVTEVVTGQSITYTFTCDDVDLDVFSSDDDCDRANIRWRRLNDGDTSAITLKTGIDDNTTATHTMSFPSRGYYVVEAQLGNENGGFPDTGGTTGGWWRLGNAVVNDTASSLSGSIAFSGANASSPPSVNAGTATNAVATVADSGGTVQLIEWDADGNNAFERREYTVPVNSGGNLVHTAVSAAHRTQSVNTASFGLKTVNARITDNGALDAADNIRRQLSFSGQLRVNAIPTASNVNTSTNEDNAVTITLAGSDADNQPNPLVYEIVSGPSPSTGTLGPVSGNQVTFTPALNYFGPGSFTYRVRDGGTGTVAAWATSNTATVSITVNPVNDQPIVDPKSVATAEDTPVGVQMTGFDVEDGTNLAYTVQSPPTNGSAVCTPAGFCTYTPSQDFFGSDSFIVRGTDSGGLFGTATVSIAVTAVNDAPVAVDDHVVVTEDAVNFPITLAASDVDSLVLTFTAPMADVQHGTLSCLGQVCTYTPDPDYNGPDTFTFEVSDGSLTDTGTITIDVTPVNDAPVATDVLDAETDEDVPVNLFLTGTDVDGDTVTVGSVTDPPNGIATQFGPNDVTYQGDLNFHGIDAFDFVVTDGNGGFDTGHVIVTVHPVNDAPVVQDQSFTVLEDTPSLLSIAAGDVDGDALAWSIVAPPANGQLFGSGPDLAYVPNFNFHGTDTFVVQVDDGNGGTDTAVITITVDPVNDQPVANAAWVTTNEDTPVDITLDGFDVDGDPLMFTAPVIGPFNGSVLCTGASCIYTPDANFHGADLFTFVVDDGNGGTDSASVVITVASVNDLPAAVGTSVTTPEDIAVAITLEATDVDGDLLTFVTTAPTNGVLQGVAPNVVYVPNPNYFGSDSFSFTVSDGNGGDDNATVSITVTPVNDAPIATGGSVVTDEDTPVSFQLGGTDVDDDPLTYAVVTQPESGVLSCDPSGACAYTPDDDFHGTVTVAYSVSDGQETAHGVFVIHVDPANDPPVAADSTVTTDEDTPVNIDLVATDADGDSLSYEVVAPPANGVVVCVGNGSSCVYTPAANYSGSDSFVWAASDGNAGQVTATVAITILPANDAPVALDVSATTMEEQAVAITLLAEDVDGDPVTFSIEAPTTNGALSLTGDTVTYTPVDDFEGVDTFIFRATDPDGASSVALGTITVIGLPLISTNIVAEAAVARVHVNLAGQPVSGSAVVFPNFKATLRRGAGAGPAIAGRTLHFSVGGQLVCTGVTNSNGVATCGGQLVGVQALLNLGYQVRFAGDHDYKPSSATGPLIQVLTLKL